jgi:uncharacterized protein YdaU (DUF1376 family)
VAAQKAPAFQFYPGDFMSDFNVIVMSGAEVGAYALLMSACWLENGVNNDMEELAILSKMTTEEFESSWSRRLSRCFVLREDGKWDHPRLQAERVKQQRFSQKMSDAANRRHANDMPRQRVGTKKAMRRHQEGNALQSSSSINTPIPPNADVDKVLQHYVGLHPKRKIVGAKMPSIVRKALKEFSADELIEALNGNAVDPWCVREGKHELSWALRDADKINEYRAKAGNPRANGPAAGVPDSRDGAW